MPRASKTPEEFVEEMARVAPTVELLGEYANARTKVECRCRTCGFTWQAVPNHLLRGSGCPQCAGTARLDSQAFVDRVAQASPSVELLGGYVNARTRVECRCRACGHVWSPYPKSLLQGSACPECAKRAATQRLAQAHERQER